MQINFGQSLVSERIESAVLHVQFEYS